MRDSAGDPLPAGRPVTDPHDPRATGLLPRPPTGGGDSWCLLGLPYDGGIPTRPGARMGPSALRRALASFGTFDGSRTLDTIEDLGDVGLPSMNGGEAHARIEEEARQLFAAGRHPVFVGGDHGCTGSVIRGLAAARPTTRLALITIDAHLDVREYTDADSLSSGTPFRRALETPILVGERTAMIGLRPFANPAFYLEWVRERNVRCFTADEVAERGARHTARQALKTAAADADAIYLSIDLDAVDGAFAPGVSAVGIGGLTAREIIELVRTVSSDGRMIGLDLMELSPPYDHDDRTAKLCARLLLEALRRV